MDSAQSQLAKNALAGEELGAQADHEAEHGEASIPGFSKGDKTETGGGISHKALVGYETKRNRNRC